MALSKAAKRNIFATSPADPWLVALEITHPDLIEPVRVVNDNLDLVVVQNDGGPVEVTFAKCSFRLQLFDDIDQQIPKATLSVDNIGRELTQWLEVSQGGKDAKCRILMGLRSELKVPIEAFWPYAAPGYFAEDYVEPLDINTWNPWEYDIRLDMSSMSIDMIEVSSDLGFKRSFMQPAVARRFDPTNSPGVE